MFDQLLFPTDGSDAATAALGVGIDVANAAGAALHVLSVVDTASLGIDVRADIQTREFEESANRVVEEATRAAEEAGVGSVSGAVESGMSVHRAIRSYVEDHGVDVVVLGTHGRTGLDRYVLGSVAEKLVRTSPIPVLTVRKPADEEGGRYRKTRGSGRGAPSGLAGVTHGLAGSTYRPGSRRVTPGDVGCVRAE